MRGVIAFSCSRFDQLVGLYDCGERILVWFGVREREGDSVFSNLLQAKGTRNGRQVEAEMLGNAATSFLTSPSTRMVTDEAAMLSSKHFCNYIVSRKPYV